MALSSNVSNAIQQIFVGLLGRPVAEQGLAYWTEQVNNGFGLEEVMANIVNEQPEYLQAIEGLTRAEAVTLHFQNLFGRNPTLDAAGGNYWIDGDGADVPVNELVLALIAGAQSNDVVALDNRVLVANAYTRAAEETGTFDIEAARDLIATVDHTNGSVADALNQIDDLTVNVTTEVQSLLAAYQAHDALLQSAATNPLVQAELAGGADVETAIATVVGTTGTTLTTLVGTNVNDPNISTAQKNAAIANARTSLTADVTDATDALNSFNTAAAKVPGLVSALNTKATTAANLAAAQAAATEAENNWDAAVDTFTTFNADATPAVSIANVAIDTAAGTVTADVGGDTGVVLFTIGANGQLVDAPAASGLAYLAQFKAATQANVNAANAVDSAAAADDAADDALGDIAIPADLQTDLGGINGTAALTTSQGLKGAVQAANQELAELEKAVTEWQQAAQLAGQLQQSNDVISDLETDLAELNVHTLEGALTATVEDDVYVFVGDSSDGASINNFGLQGDDAIYFGEGFSLVQLSANQNIGGNVGDANALEIFWQQNGLNVTLYVEAETFGGNATGTGDIIEISLTGVNGNELSLTDGYLIA